MICNSATPGEGTVRFGVLVKKMPTRHTIANFTSSRGSVMQWFLHLGGLGLIPLGLLDGSLVPILPGSMDIATILLAAHDKKLWFYYAAMATAGSVLGGFLAYRLARKGGKEALEKKLRSDNIQKIYERFERWGFAAIVVFALLPPPMPLFPVVLAAGTTRYSVTKFLTALTLGRAVRFTVLAFLAARYGGQILTLISHHEYVVLLAVIGLAVSGFVLFYLVRKAKPKTRTA
jgi:membrane protein YqaA with SNARE-associated domain